MMDIPASTATAGQILPTRGAVPITGESKDTFAAALQQAMAAPAEAGATGKPSETNPIGMPSNRGPEDLPAPLGETVEFTSAASEAQSSSPRLVEASPEGTILDAGSEPSAAFVEAGPFPAGGTIGFASGAAGDARIATDEPAPAIEDDVAPEGGISPDRAPADEPQPQLVPVKDAPVGLAPLVRHPPEPAARAGTAGETFLVSTAELVDAAPARHVANAPGLLPAEPLQAPEQALPQSAAVAQASSFQPVHPVGTPASTGHDTAKELPRLTLQDPVGDRLGAIIARRVGEGGEEVQIRMDPAELGQIRVRLSFDEGGSLRAIVAADSPQVLEAIRRDSAELGRTLSDAGVRTDAQSFRFDRGGSSGNGGDLPRHWAHAAQDHGGSPESDAESASQYRPLLRSGRLDLMA